MLVRFQLYVYDILFLHTLHPNTLLQIRSEEYCGILFRTTFELIVCHNLEKDRLQTLFSPRWYNNCGAFFLFSISRTLKKANRKFSLSVSLRESNSRKLNGHNVLVLEKSIFQNSKILVIFPLKWNSNPYCMITGFATKANASKRYSKSESFPFVHLN